MAVKIRLKRMGKIRQPYFRIVVADSRTKRDGRVIEQIGKYHPKADPSVIEVDSDRAQYWLGVGAQPSEAVAVLLKLTGDWQKFKGEPAPDALKVADTGKSKADIFNEALKEAGGDTGAEPTTKKTSKKTAKTAKKTAAETPDEPADKADKAEAPADEPAPVPADETPEVAAEQAEETVGTPDAEDVGKSESES